MIFLLIRLALLIISLLNNIGYNQIDIMSGTNNIFPYYDLFNESVTTSSYSVRIQNVRENTYVEYEDAIPYKEVLLDIKPSEKLKIKENKENEPLFYWKPIDQEIANRIVGLSYKDNAPVELSDLAYLKITYWGYDDKQHIGEMVVHISVAKEVLEIFKELYDNKYYIEKMVLIDEYDADDNKSMADNNTSSFCFRNIVGSNNYISKHSYGLAIDINPLVNPYVKGELILPKDGATYVNRQLDSKGMIKKGDPCYEAFIKRGWQWGGNWDSPKDYQHFEKDLLHTK